MNPEMTHITISFIHINGSEIVLEGIYNSNEIFQLKLRAGSDVYINSREDTAHFPSDRKPFCFNLPISSIYNNQQTDISKEIIIEILDENDVCYPFTFGKFSPLQMRYKNSYYRKDNIVVAYHDNHLSVSVSAANFSYEHKLLKEMLHSGIRGKKDFLLRTLKKVLPDISRKIWVISDRPSRGGDNGEALFRYVNQNKCARSYFAISKNCRDYNRLKKYGKVIPFCGIRYKLLYLTGAVMISSQGEDIIFRPFKGSTAVFSDLIPNNKFVFLQHGVIKDDMSDWLNRYQKNISIFICTTVPEYKSILKFPYDYSDSQIKLTGLPRHDLLQNEPEKLVTVMFTWRYFLVDLPDSNGARMLKDDFTNSSYYRIHKELMQSERLNTCLKRNGCRMQIVLHPCMEQAQEIIQSISDNYDVLVSADYNEIFRTSSLLVTDYSSVAFDFALLRKPIIYCQADRDEFFSGEHMYKSGYFSYERDGFGYVAYSTDECISMICNMLSSGCVLENKYAKRIEQTFPYDNTGNCKRVCDAILEKIK